MFRASCIRPLAGSGSGAFPLLASRVTIARGACDGEPLEGDLGRGGPTWGVYFPRGLAVRCHGRAGRATAVIGRAPRARASAFESGIVATDGEKCVIESGSGISEIEKPVDRFTRLWEPDVPVPGRLRLPGVVSRYLDRRSARGPAGGSAYPLDARPAPAPASLPVGVSRDRRARRADPRAGGRRATGPAKSAGRLNETIPDPNPDALHSETPTEAVDPPARQGLAGGEAGCRAHRRAPHRVRS